MNLKPTLYNNLTPMQRVIATIEAEARADTQEVERLVKSCPKYAYTTQDWDYSKRMLTLMIMALAVESDIRGQALGFWIAMTVDQDDRAQMFLQNIADIQAAWHQTLNSYGIDPEAMVKAGPPQHSAFEFLSDFMPDPQLEKVHVYNEEIKEFLNMKDSQTF